METRNSYSILKPNRNDNDEAIHVVKIFLNRPIVNHRLMSPLAHKAVRSKLYGRNWPPRRFQNLRLIPFPPDTTPPLPLLGSDAVGSRRRALRSSLHLIPFPCSPSHDVRRCEDRPWHQRPRCLEQCREEEREKRQERSRHEADNRSGEGSSEDEREREQEKEEKQKDRRSYVFDRCSFCRVVRSEQGSLRVLQPFDEVSRLLRGIQDYRVAVLEANPRSFVVPSHTDAHCICYVAEGTSVRSVRWVFSGRDGCLNLQNLSMGPPPHRLTECVLRSFDAHPS
jgi:hypothetical protein